MMFCIQLRCNQHAFIDRTVEHYKQSDQVRDLGEDILIEIDNIIKDASFERFFSSRMITLSKWNAETQWRTGRSDAARQCPISPVLRVRNQEFSWVAALDKLIDRDKHVGDQVTVYAMMRWLQMSSHRARLKAEVSSIAPPDMVDSLLQVFEKYTREDSKLAYHLTSVLGEDFYLDDDGNIMIILYKFDCSRVRDPVLDLALNPVELETKQRILKDLYPELDTRFITCMYHD